MNIFGEGFPDEIIKQVELRQKVYGAGYANGVARTNEQIVYLNANTSWCQLVSSTNIENIYNLNNPTVRALDLSGNELAKKFILFNGTTDLDSSTARSGISNKNNLLGINSDGISSAYGIGGNEFGIRPMAGIQTISVTHENRGSLRRANVKIKAWNRAQFEIIDVLYLRVGFSVLLEWGNTMYYDDNGDLQTGQDKNSFEYRFLEGGDSYSDMLKMIADKRLKTSGNYDAMFARVTNFHWSFQPDGSYDIEVNLSSVGDIIESLKINVLLDGGQSAFKSIKQEKNQDLSNLNNGAFIDAFASKSTIGTFLYFLKVNLDDNGIILDARTGEFEMTSRLLKVFRDKYFTVSSVNKSDLQTEQNVLNVERFKKDILSSAISEAIRSSHLDPFNLFSDTVSNLGNLGAVNFSNIDPTKLESTHHDAILINYDGNGDGDQYYVRLGTFLQFLQNTVVPQISDNKGGYIPSLYFDFEEKTNLMYLNPLQVSIDPRICVINRPLTIDKGLWNYDVAGDKFINSDLKVKFPDVDYGQIMNTYVNMRFILEKIDSLRDNKGTVVLVDFLKSILGGINEALGGINDFDVFIDETTNTVKVIDKNPLPNSDEIIEFFKGKGIEYGPSLSNISNTKLVKFDLYGYNTQDSEFNPGIYDNGGHAGFIKDFSFKTELTPEYATMITVGAAANGVVVGEDSTALSKLNNGLEDRFKKSMVNGNYKTSPIPDDTLLKSQNEYKALDDKFKLIYKEYIDFLKTLSIYYQKLNTDDIDTYKTTLSNLNQYQLELKKLKEKIDTLNSPEKKSPSSMAVGTGYIPFNLSLTMDGLSGMKINQKFSIDTSYLPSNYPNSVEFLIKNMTHEVVNNKWYTKLDSYCISKGSFTGSADQDLYPQGSTSSPYAPPLDISNTKSTNGRWANELRKVLAQLGYTEKGVELDAGGDISEDIYKAASEVLQNIKQQIPEVQIRVSSGNDAYHQNLDYGSSHKTGNAVDFTLMPPTTASLNKVVNILQVYKLKNMAFKFIDEYRNPSSKATAGHIHIQV